MHQAPGHEEPAAAEPAIGLRLDIDDFLARYWQKRPLRLRGALEPPPDWIDGDELAGLAVDDVLPARLVRGNAEQSWGVTHGPLPESLFAALPERDWTLLVQDLDKHHSRYRELLGAFGFLPSWRLDDVMVSYAVPGGSVGPHVDDYDVFLIQARGRRRWQWSRPYDPQTRADTELSVLAAFEAEDDFIAEPGDLLYLPPRVAHHGVAETECLTVSVGLRAPSAAECLAALAGWTAEHGDNPRYADPDLARSRQPDRLDAATAARLRALLQSALELADDDLLRWFGAFATEYRLAEALLPPAPEATVPDADTLLSRSAAARLAWYAGPDRATLMANGESTECEAAAADFVCRRQRFSIRELQAHTSDAPGLAAWLLTVRGFSTNGGLK